MKLRKRHAWSAVLIGLFVLPVVRPEGFPDFEGRVDSALNWTGRFEVANPHSWRVPTTPDAREGDAHAKDLEVITIAQREEYFRLAEDAAQRVELRAALAGTDRLPLAVSARILRAHDAATGRRSLLIDRGAEDGLEVGQAAVLGRVLVGLVQHVEAHSARVQLITDPYASLHVALRTQEGARVTAWLRGGTDEKSMPLRNVRLGEGREVREGDPVLTDASTERVPAGLVVGRVVVAADVGVEGRADVRIRPLFDLDRSETLLVLVPGR